MKIIDKKHLKEAGIILVLALALILGVIPEDQTYAASIKVGKPKVSVSFNNNKISLKISKTNNAEGFKIYVKKPQASKYEKLKILKQDGKAERTYSFTVAKSGEYSIKVRGYNNSTGKTIWGKYSKAAPILAETSTNSKAENERKSKDIENYNLLVMAINVATTNLDVIREVKESTYYITFSSAGVAGMSTNLLKSCRLVLPELDDPGLFCVTSSDWADKVFTITIEYVPEGGVVVRKTCAPTRDF